MRRIDLPLSVERISYLLRQIAKKQIQRMMSFAARVTGWVSSKFLLHSRESAIWDAGKKSANDVGMRNFLPNGFGMMKSPANLEATWKFWCCGRSHVDS